MKKSRSLRLFFSLVFVLAGCTGKNGSQVQNSLSEPPGDIDQVSHTWAEAAATAGSPPWTGIVSSTTAIDWSTAGVIGGIPNRTTICATISASTYGNGSTDATSGIQSALNSCAANGVVSLSAGTFLINSSLNIPSNVSLRGAGANQTILSAKGKEDALVSMGSAQPNVSGAVSVTGGTSAGSTSITLSSASGVSVGSYIIINELNPSFVNINGSEGPCTWCDSGYWNGTRALGQIVQVTSVSGTTVGISPALFQNYTMTPLAVPLPGMVQGAGVEDLQVYANNTGYGADFGMTGCANCWISGVEGNYTDGNWVTAAFTYHSSIVNSYFSNAFLHTPGTYDSDVDVESYSTLDLVQNDIMQRGHVGLMLEWGSAGNVLAYNYLLGNYDSSSPYVNMMGIDYHGAHPQKTLIEGNVTPNIHDDSIWGSSSDTTTFRNWTTGTTLICTPTDNGRQTVSCSNGIWGFQAARAMEFDFLSTNENMVGDVIGSKQMQSLDEDYSPNGSPLSQFNMVVAVCGPAPCGPGSRDYDNGAYGYSLGFGEASDDGSSGFDSLTPYQTAFFHGEYSNITGQTTWASGVTQTLPPSFYLSAKPSWFGNVPFPAIGPDVTGGVGPGGHAYMIPAEVCYTQVMGGVDQDSTGSPLATFNAATCYGSNTNPPSSPTPTPTPTATPTPTPTAKPTPTPTATPRPTPTPILPPDPTPTPTPTATPRPTPTPILPPDPTPTPPTATGPSVSIISPATGASFSPDTTIDIQAAAGAGTTQVDVYVNGDLVCTAGPSEFWSGSYNCWYWLGNNPGSFKLQAVAYKNSVRGSPSAVVQVNVK